MFLNIKKTEKYIGVGAARVRGLFKVAQETAKQRGQSYYFIFIDEIDAIKDYLIWNAKNKKDSKTSSLSQDQKILLLEETNHIDHFLRILI
ncbi:AAA family ATPase, partial [Candidatus Phytoplasma asteris]|uniref:AAA family ATPase n=1 Tax=Candidatus Phytoplasma asteris TaxID=85620 RepID=UPI0039E1A6CD